MRETANQVQIADLMKTTLFDSSQDPGSCFLHRPPETRERMSGAGYLRFAIVSPYTALFPVLTALLSAMCQTWWIFLIGSVLQLITTVSLPRMAWFRELADRRASEVEEAALETRRAQVRAEIGDEHRGALERLESRVKKVRERAQRGGRVCVELMENGLGLSELTAMFVRLAVALQARRERLNSANPELIARRLRELERADCRPASAAVWENAMRVRSSNLERMRGEVETLESVMASIVEYANFLDECCVPGVPEEMGERIDGYLSGWRLDTTNPEPEESAQVLAIRRS